MRGLHYLEQDEDFERVEKVRTKRTPQQHLQDLQRPEALTPRARTVARRKERRIKDQQHSD